MDLLQQCEAASSSCHVWHKMMPFLGPCTEQEGMEQGIIINLPSMLVRTRLLPAAAGSAMMERQVCPTGQLGCCCQQAQAYNLMGALGKMGLQHCNNWEQHWSAAWLYSAAKTPQRRECIADSAHPTGSSRVTTLLTCGGGWGLADAPWAACSVLQHGWATERSVCPPCRA